MADLFDVQVTTLLDLKSDKYGHLISEVADIIGEVFSEPPWNERFSAARILFWTGRRNNEKKRHTAYRKT